MFFVEEIFKNDSLEENEVNTERMIDRENDVIYSDHRGLIFLITKEIKNEDKVQHEGKN